MSTLLWIILTVTLTSLSVSGWVLVRALWKTLNEEREHFQILDEMLCNTLRCLHESDAIRLQYEREIREKARAS
jgi:hypothetical protein